MWNMAVLNSESNKAVLEPSHQGEGSCEGSCEGEGTSRCASMAHLSLIMPHQPTLE